MSDTKQAQAPATTIKASASGQMMPSNFEEAWRLSKALAHGGGEVVPEHFRGREGAVFAAIQKGAELGFSPMAALGQIAVINGRATVWGDALPALVQRAGHRLDEWLEGSGNEMKAVAKLTRADTGQEFVREFSWADAERAQLTSKKGPWQTYPKRMLQMRARGFAVRDGAADMMLGVGLAEEAMDTPRMRDVTPTGEVKGPRSAAEKMAALADQEPAPEPDPKEAEKSVAQDADEPAGATTPEEGENAASEPEKGRNGEADAEGAPAQDAGEDVDAIADATKRGREAHGLGIPLGAVPDDLRGHEALRNAWQNAWREADKAAQS